MLQILLLILLGFTAEFQEKMAEVQTKGGELLWEGAAGDNDRTAGTCRQMLKVEEMDGGSRRPPERLPLEFTRRKGV